MITILQKPSTTPITLQRVAEYIGIADKANPILGTILEGVIDEVEKAMGIGVGIHQVKVDILPPIPTIPYQPLTSVLLLPYSPITQITKIEQYDPVTFDIWEINPEYVIRNTIPDQLWLKNECNPTYGIVVTYSGGFNELPTEYEQIILRNCMARWENRQLKSLIDVLPVVDPRYLRVFT